MPGRDRPLIVPVFLPHAGCPHRCVFCNQKAITRTRTTLPDPDQVSSEIRTFLQYTRPGRRVRQIAFFGGNFLGIPYPYRKTCLEVATPFIRSGQVDGIRFSTRPDTITDPLLDELAGYAVQTVELGVQSMDDEVLSQAGRGHTALHTVDAAFRLRARGYRTGMQLMIGLPGESPETAMASAQRVSELQPDFVRIYPTLVLRDTELETRYRSGAYHPMALTEAVNLSARIHTLFREHGIPVIRMGLPASEGLTPDAEIVAGPYHPAFGHLVLSEILLSDAIRQIASLPHPAAAISITVHPRNLSRIRGWKNNHIEILQTLIHNRPLTISTDTALGEWTVRVSETRTPSA